MAIMRKSYADRVSNLREQMEAMKAGRFDLVQAIQPNQNKVSDPPGATAANLPQLEESSASSKAEAPLKELLETITGGYTAETLFPSRMALQCAQAIASCFDKAWQPQAASKGLGISGQAPLTQAAFLAFLSSAHQLSPADPDRFERAMEASIRFVQEHEPEAAAVACSTDSEVNVVVEEASTQEASTEGEMVKEGPVEIPMEEQAEQSERCVSVLCL